MKKQEIQVLTFTPIYDEVEDRIRLIVNYKDLNRRIDFMLTRAFIIKLIPMLEEYLQKNFSNHQKELYEQVQDSYQTKTETSHIDSVVKEELLFQVDLTMLEDKQNILFVLSSKYTVAKAILNKDLLSSLIYSLKKIIPKYNWGVYF